MINFKCDICGEGMEAPSFMIGETLKCPSCGCGVIVPKPEPIKDKPPPADITLLPCPDCGKDISSSAISCPNCGRPMQNPATKKTAERIVIKQNSGCGCLILAALLLIALILLFTLTPINCCLVTTFMQSL